MKSIKVNILKKEVVDMLYALEALRLIEIKPDDEAEKPPIDWHAFEGAMTRQSKQELDQQLREMRAEWE